MIRILIAVSSTIASADAPSLFSSPGVGTAGVFVTLILAYLLGYLNIVENSEHARPHLRSLLIATSIPLWFAFVGILIYESLAVIGFL